MLSIGLSVLAIVVVDGFVTEFVSINRGVPRGTVLGPILFSIVVNDIRPVYRWAIFYQNMLTILH